MRRSRLAALGLLAVLVAGACGSRANKNQVAEALRTGASGSGVSAGSQDAASADNGVTGSNASSQAASAAGGVGGGGLSAAVAAARARAASLPAGGNGGATDVGVTPTSITVANISIQTGPVPGLFSGAVYGTDAALAYQNSLGGVYGRQLKLLSSDDQFDCGQNKALTESYLPKAFAFVGSFSLFDNCGADVFNAHPEVPDVHNGLSLAAQQEANNFSSQPIRQGSATGHLIYFKNKAPDAITSAASLIGDVQSAKDAWAGAEDAAKSLGYKFIYERIFAPTETDFTADIVQMRSQGVKMLFLLSVDVKSAARIEKAALSQNWHPTITALGASAYDLQLAQLAGNDAIENDYLFLPSAMYLGEDRSVNKEVDLFLTWMKKTHPSANVDLFAVYGWTSARLFMQALQSAGPRATRASLLAALRNVHQFDSNGLLALGDPAAKSPPHCYILLQVHGGKFARLDSPAPGYRCDGSYHFKQ
jgi:ABC-type branched-subunit amino acid transport system substrate-binding protein